MTLKKGILIFYGIGLLVSSSAYKYTSTKYKDINISNDNGILQCDQIECPADSARCHVVKLSVKENGSKLLRENVCYDEDENILKEKIWSEPYSGKMIDLTIDMLANEASGPLISHEGSFFDDDFDFDFGFKYISRGIGSIFRSVGSFLDSFGDWF